jgi:23S rRNA pseudouridine2605 synthase
MRWRPEPHLLPPDTKKKGSPLGLSFVFLHATVEKQQFLKMKKTNNFQKFADKKKNSAVKEQFRQEKKQWKKERSEAIDKRFEAKRKSQSPAAPAQPVKKNFTERPEELQLNKFIAHSGVCSRRDAAELVKAGKVKVNGKLVVEPGFKVMSTDEITVNGKKVTLQKNMVYILLNKPKDFITTSSDPQGRQTVMQLIKHATPERVYPVGRLDRNTTGVLLLTNDGDLAQKLSHPSYEIKKIYEVKLDKPLTKRDFDTILKGIQLEDGFIAPDGLAYADAKDKAVIGIEIHSGRNRIVRRIFEFLGYDVKNLDRVLYANLTKKNVERGKWRFLTEKEVRLLKYMNKSFLRKEGATKAAQQPEDDE